jgi:hypothetical protein
VVSAKAATMKNTKMLLRTLRRTNMEMQRSFVRTRDGSVGLEVVYREKRTGRGGRTAPRQSS